MKRPLKKPELLCPAGGMDSLRAALSGGADAVYFGAKDFSARQKAKNFDRDEIVRAAELCHERGVKCYAAFNTLILDREMARAMEQAAFLYRAGVDALIVADVGLARLIRKDFPDLPLHASTQMFGHSAAAARAFAAMGFTRMVAAREIDRENLALLCQNSPIEIELFVHGALCACHSGQCLMSSMIGRRSGNRGECAQPCRLPYNGAYPLSLKDLSLAGHMKEILSLGVASLKIEGRLKGPDYVYAAASLFRTLLDEERCATEKELARLGAVVSRSGFTDGYFVKKTGPAMLGRRTEEDKLLSRKAPIRPKDCGARGEPIALSRPERTPSPVALLPGAPSPHTAAALFISPEQIPDQTPFDLVYLPLEKYDPQKASGVALPPVIFDKEEAAVRKKLEEAVKRGARHVLLAGPAQIELCRGLNLRLHGSWRWNVTNGFALNEAAKELCDVIVSPELNLAQMRDLPAEKVALVYGRLPLMLLEKHVGAKALIDRKRFVFPILRCGGRDEVLNSAPFYMADREDALQKAGLENRFFVFTTESRREVEAVISAIKSQSPAKGPIKRIL